MKYYEFLEKVKQNNLSEKMYCINNVIADDVYCITNNYNKWEVFYRERGQEFEKEIFRNEEDAWENLLNRLLETVRIADKIQKRNTNTT